MNCFQYDFGNVGEPAISIAATYGVRAVARPKFAARKWLKSCRETSVRAPVLSTDRSVNTLLCDTLGLAENDSFWNNFGRDGTTATKLRLKLQCPNINCTEVPKWQRPYSWIRQIQEYCLAGGSWSTVGPLASALQEALKPYSCLPNQQRGSPSWRQSTGHSTPRRQANRTA